MSDKLIRNYEAMVILNPTLSDDENAALIAKMTQVLTDGGVTMRETAKWGRRRLAYEIDKKNDGYYVIFYFTLGLENGVLEAFERFCRYDEQVMRHQVVRVPTTKRGVEIAQLVPASGYMADFKLEHHAHSPRRRFDGPPRGDQGPSPAASEAAPAPAAVAEAPAGEEAKAE